MRALLIVLLFLIMSTTDTDAQILKINKRNIDADSSNFFVGAVNTDFNLNNQNSTADETVTFKGFVANADLVYAGKKHAYILMNKINYFSSTGGPFLSTGFAHFRINWLRKKVLSYESFTQIQYDDGRNMPLRILAGSGVRWSISEERKYNLYLGTGAMYEQEEWKSQEEDRLIIKRILKNSSYLSYQVTVGELVNFNGIVYFQTGYDQHSDVVRNRFSGDFTLSFDLTNHLSFNVSFVAQYEHRPIIEINKWVYSLTNGLRWEF